MALSPAQPNEDCGSLPMPIEGGSGKTPCKTSSSIITVVRDLDHVLGKKFHIDSTETVTKQAAVSLSFGIACMHQVDSHEQLAALLIDVGNDPHAAVINSVFQGIDIGEEFVISSAKEIEKRTGIPPSDRVKQKGVHVVEHSGKQMKMVGRFKENVRSSCWQYLDRDIDEHTPEEFASLSDDQWIAAVAQVMLGFTDISYCKAASTSSRVLRDGKPVGAGNGHFWFKVQNPDDINRFRTAFMVKAAELGMTWLKPRYSRSEPGKTVGHSLTTLIDTSVFTPGRLVFVGQPVVTGDLTVEPQSVTVHHGETDALDTSAVVLPDSESIQKITRKAGVEMTVQNTGNGLVTHIHDLTLDTVIETEGNGILTVHRIVESGGSEKIRCQSPFRDSNSFAAFVSTGKDGAPFVHDVGTGTTHWLNKVEHSELQLTRAQGTVAKILEAAPDDCGAPHEPQAIEALAILRDQRPADYQRTRAELKKANKDISVVAMDDAVKAKKTESLVAETHHGFAKSLLSQLTVDGWPPVGYEGALYAFDSVTGLWACQPTEFLARMVAESFDGLDNCKRSNDYRNIAEHAISLATDDAFFTGAPIGLATPDGFISLDGNNVKTEPLMAAHCQRVKIDVTPTAMDTPLFDTFLHETFQSKTPDEEAQQERLLQETFGATMLGISYRFQKSILFYDPFGRAGKGTVERFLRQLVPPSYVSAVSPFYWDNEYYLATLAGARLNVVGELPEQKALPAAAYKSVIGGDLLSGRHPSYRPFTFKNEAAHLFMSNHLINTRDHSEAFYARWLIIEFPNSRLRSGLPIDPSLADRIIENELAGIAYWALQGAIRLLEQDAFSDSVVHDRMMAKWRLSTNSLDEFIHECCDVGDDSYTFRRSHFYRAYTAWCKDSGRQPFSKSRVKELLAHNLNFGIRFVELNGYETLRGIRNKPETFTPLASVPSPPKDVTF